MFEIFLKLRSFQILDDKKKLVTLNRIGSMCFTLVFSVLFKKRRMTKNHRNIIEISSNFMSNFELKSKNNLIGYFLIRNTLTKT